MSAMLFQAVTCLAIAVGLVFLGAYKFYPNTVWYARLGKIRKAGQWFVVYWAAMGAALILAVLAGYLL